jgi:TatD DNase family protein
MRFFDSHAHLNIPEFDIDRDAALARAREAGVDRMVNVGIDAESSRIARDLAGREPGLYAAAAVHPNYVADCGEEELVAVEAMIREGGFVAVGETGLDYYREHCPPDRQRDAFRRHLRLAEESGLPVIVHCRDAQADCVGILEEEAARRDIRGRFVMHCFGGSAVEARTFVDLGGYVSFSGVVTFPNAKATRAAAAAVPPERLLIETDCPFLAPQPKRGRRNEPAFVIHTAEEVARVHGLELSALAELTTANALAVFGIEEKA